MLIYSPDKSPRLKYVLDFIFRDVYNTGYRITRVKEEAISHNGPKINYSNEMIEGVPFIRAIPLLFEESIRDQNPGLKEWIDLNGIPAIFPVGKESIVPFDIFAAVFYYISRYEEYLPFTGDKHGRFHSGLSLSAKLGILDKPIVDHWLKYFGEILTKTFDNKIEIAQPRFSFDPTIDIDNAWAFRHKGLIRTIGSVLKTGQSMEYRNFRYQVLRGKQEDPFDQYKQIDLIHQEFGFSPKYFFLVGKNSNFDRNLSPKNRAFRKLIKSISDKYEIGLHPSYASDFDTNTIRIEKEKLSEICEKDISISRQHYLRLNFPSTYQSLSKAGILSDYTMGYADASGFRAGTSRCFNFFDLENNKAGSLRVFPFQVMDAGLKDYEKCNPGMASEGIKLLINNTKEVGGTFRSLWHNESFSESFGWEGWTKVYREMLKMASE